MTTSLLWRTKPNLTRGEFLYNFRIGKYGHLHWTKPLFINVSSILLQYDLILLGIRSQWAQENYASHLRVWVCVCLQAVRSNLRL